MRFTVISACAVACMLTVSGLPAEERQADYQAAAHKLAQKYVLIDTHVDVPYRLEEKWSDVSGRTEDGDFDYERARQGGLDIPFMSIYTPAEAGEEGAFELANRLIDRVEAIAGRAPDKFAIVKTPKQAEKAVQQGLMGLAMGMENGSPLEGDLENVAFFKNRGISYITFAHSLSNHISDSSYDKERQWNGLSPFGKELVGEMNRQGVMIDISHVSDDAFWQVMELSNVPVIASHSSPRVFTPGWERNMSDDMIKAMAAKGGVIQINFGSSFLTQAAREWYDTMSDAREAYLEKNGFDEHGEEAEAFGEKWREEHPFPYADLGDVVANFQHVIGLVGTEHVGIGSDFDGVGDSLPQGMKDVSDYPNLIAEFLRLEYSTDEIAAIMGGNLMRVWQAVETYARQAAVAEATASP